ncbi:T-complex protein 1 subunit zeta [Tribolium madens]|uniref:T-complex protein 1 subunit zeta n=1 Tax=Tribolium madens TaxID=41895 RepID=UPI001CF74E37|nr:T-complex protein 1 subunit zeta [Tribolium madens]
MAISLLNPKAEVARAAQALAVNISAAKGIQDVMKSNLGPKGTMKMLVSGAGDIKITKDGNVLLHEMQIQHPTASLIARASTAQDDMTGDGTTSTVLVIGELLKQADILIAEGLHPRVVTEGFDKAREKTLEILDSIKVPIEITRESLLDVARTSLRTKVHQVLANVLADVCVDAILAIKPKDKSVDLHMVELMEMQHKTETDTTLVKGLVLDHGSRHPDMPKRLKNCYILTCNVSMEYEKSEVNSGFFYKTAEEREKMVQAEREFIEQRVKKVIDLKKKLCDGTDKSFVVINQKGIDPMSLDLLAKEGIMALRRAKRRNMERLALACGGVALNHLDDIQESQLGYAGVVYEHVLGENKFTFVEECKIPQSVTILIKGPNKHTLAQIKDAVRDGLRAINNAIEDKSLIPGAGAFEVTAHKQLMSYKDTVKGKSRLGIGAYAEALLVIPKVLATNSGFDAQDTIVKLQEESRLNPEPIGLDLTSGQPINPKDAGIFDNYIVKKQIINSCSVIASNLLLVDEIMRAGMSSLKG